MRIVQLIAVGEPRLFAFFWWLFCYVFMGLAPAVQIRSGIAPSTTPDPPTNFYWPAILLVAVGIAAFELGGLVERSASRSRQETPSEFSGIDKRRTVLVAIVGGISSAYFMATLGLGAFGLDRASFGSLRSAAWPELAVSSMVFGTAVFVSLVAAHAIMAMVRSPGASLGLGGRVTAALLAMAALIIANPIGNARYVAGSVAFSVLVLMGGVATRRRVQVLFAGTIVAFLYLFPIADAFRRENFSTSRAGFFEEYMGNGDYDAFVQIANAMAFTDENGFAFGRQLLGSVFFWVPRGAWPSKPIDTGVLLAEDRGYSFTNLSAPLWAEAWVNGGLVLLVTTFLVLGWLVRKLDRKSVHGLTSQRGSFWAVVPAVLPVYSVILFRGSLLQATGAFALILAATLVVRRSAAGTAPGAAATAAIARRTADSSRRIGGAKPETP